MLQITRNDFPALEQRRNGRPPVYFDNACTTLVPRDVIGTINEYYACFPSCGGRRSHHWFAEEVTRRVDASRRSLAGFIHAASEQEIVFASNTTQAINMVALGFSFRPGDVVLLSDREHNSNLLPWLRLQEAGAIRVKCATVQQAGGVDLDAFEAHFKREQVRLVSLAYTSNVTGETLPAAEMIAIAHRYGARVLLDAAQTAPHRLVDVAELDADFLAFSLHKMCGPRGAGVLYAKAELLDGRSGGATDVIEPVILGGGTVDDTTYGSYRLLAAPERFEAGIPDYPGLAAAGTAVEYLQRIGMDRIAAHEERLNTYLTEALLERYGGEGWFNLIGPEDAGRRGGILTFEVHRPNAVGIAAALDAKSNVMIRDGVFCAHSYFNDRFGPNWTHPRSHREHRMVYRVSLYFYNTLEECDIFLETLDEIFRERSYV